MSPPGNDKFFFVHVMKTGGTSFAEIVRQNFEPQERYPEACLAENANFGRRTASYIHVPTIVSEVNENIAALRMVAGHIPYATRRLFAGTFTTLTVLRHPVARTLSYLKHCRNFHPEHTAMSFEEIYEQAWFNAMFIGNYQTKIFSMTAEEALDESKTAIDTSPIPSLEALRREEQPDDEVLQFQQRNPARYILELFASATARVTVDQQRLQTAINNLRDVELIGVTERYEAFLRRLSSDHGWRVGTVPRENAGSNEAISMDFARRIEQDNSADMALYEIALSVCA